MKLFGPRYPVLRQGIVNLKSGTTFKAVVWRREGEWLVLRNAELLEGKKLAVAIDGEIAVRVCDVDFIQIVGSG